MKKGILALIIFTLIFSFGLISASCQLTPQLVSQDPSPVVPGDYVKLVFQVTGIQDPSCGQITFQLDSTYPISFDPGVSPIVSINSGSYVTNYNSFATIPYTVRVDPNAINGNSTIELDYRATGISNNSGIVASYFSLYVQDIRATFQVFVKNYDYSTHDLTLEVLNTGKNDVQSLTVTIPPNQANLSLKGPNTNVIGSLSANDFTTADFQVSPNKGNINMILSYNDITGTMRNANATVYFDPTVFYQSPATPVGLYVIIVLVILIIIYIIYRRRKKNKRKKLLRE